MSQLTATFLGTGTSQGIPVIACNCGVCKSDDFRDNRLRTSLMISKGSKNIVIDTGPDFRQQMLRESVSQLEAVVFTHEHKDHTSGMDDIRAFNYSSKKAMQVFATAEVQNSLRREFHYVFSADKYPGVPEVNLNAITNDAFELMGESIMPIDVLHFRLPVKAFRIRDFGYVTDANFIPEESFEKLKGVKWLVLNALRKQPHVSHFNLDEAIQVANRIGAEKTWLTHISHMMGKHGEVTAELPSNIELAFDGLKVDIG